jgi:o-succinylbenzoate synthase
MKLLGAELRRVRLPLVTPFRTAFGIERERDLLIVRVLGPDGEGFGECSALSEPVYSSEYVDGAQDVIRRHLLPRLLELSDVSAEQVGTALRSVHGHLMAKATLEMAILVADLNIIGQSLASYLGSTQDSVGCGVSVGIHDSVPELLDAVERYLADDYLRVKLKIEPGWDIDAVAAVRDRFGDIPLQVDANGAYTLGDARHLERLDAYDLLLIEQPLPADQLRAHAELAAILRTPICLDESITSARAAEDAIDLGACEIVNVKAGRVGGYLEACRVHNVCRARGVPVWCGGMLEAGLGRAANIALAALPGFTLPGDISATARYYEQDITEPFLMKEGRIAVPTGPGLGVRVLRDVLEERTTSVEHIGRLP